MLNYVLPIDNSGKKKQIRYVRLPTSKKTLLPAPGETSCTSSALHLDSSPTEVNTYNIKDDHDNDKQT